MAPPRGFLFLRICGDCALKNVSTSDFQSEVGEVFGEVGGELPAKLEGDFRASFAGKIVRNIFHQTPPQISPSNFTTRFWVVAGPIKCENWCVFV